MVWIQQLVEHHNREHTKDCTTTNSAHYGCSKNTKLENPQSGPKDKELEMSSSVEPKVLVTPIEIQ